jgi:hypothetical protein
MVSVAISEAFFDIESAVFSGIFFISSTVDYIFNYYLKKNEKKNRINIK